MNFTIQSVVTEKVKTTWKGLRYGYKIRDAKEKKKTAPVTSPRVDSQLTPTENHLANINVKGYPDYPNLIAGKIWRYILCWKQECTYLARLFCDLGSLARTNLINIFGSLSLFSQTTSQISNESDRGSTMVEKKVCPEFLSMFKK